MEDTGEIWSQLSSSFKCDILNFTGANVFTVNNISFKTLGSGGGIEATMDIILAIFHQSFNLHQPVIS